VSCFLIRLRDRHRLREYYTRDISAGGTLLKTPSPDEVAPDVDMILVHPETDEEFPLAGRVVRVIHSPSIQERGVAVQFTQLPATQEQALLAFIETGVNYLERSPEERAEKLALLRRAVELTPESPLPLAALGQALLDDGERDAAVAAFEDALAIGAHSRAHKHLVAIRRHERQSGSFAPIPGEAPK
jgi:Tfp pilus assembly protein PilZ